MSNLLETLKIAKSKLPLDALMRMTGHGEYVSRSCKSPFREEKTASWGVYHDENGDLKWKDFTTGEGGDQVDFLAAHLGCSTRDAMTAFFEMAGVSGEMPRSLPVKSQKSRKVSEPERETEPEPSVELKPFDWQSCLDAFNEERQAGFAEWRNYTPKFVSWLKEQGLVGIYDNCPATPVIDNGVVVGCQYRTNDGSRYANNTPGEKTPAKPLVIGKIDAPNLVVMESPWDAFALLDAIGAYSGTIGEMLCVTATRSASNHGKLAEVFKARAATPANGDVILIGQNDPPRRDGKPTGHDTLEEGVRKQCADHGLTLKVTMPPAHVKDLNDWWRERPENSAFLDMIEAAKTSTKSKLTVRTVEELLEFKHDDKDNYFGDRVLAEGQPATFLGPGGVGKSRLLMQQAICMITGRPFLGIQTRARMRRWLMIQTENNNRRLQIDLKGIISGLQLSEYEIQQVVECLFIHTIEADHDVFMDMANEKEFQSVQSLITDFNPDFVVFDPLNTFTTGDLNSDADMRGICTAITRATKRGNPKRVPIVVHHSLTGKAGAQKATGWDKASYGRNSKVLQAWTRSQINIAPRDPEDQTKLLITCGKNNNGAFFPDIGVRFDEDKNIYEVDETFDPQEFQEAVGNVRKSREREKINPAEVAALFEGEITGLELVELVKKHFQCGKTKAYKIIDSAKAGKFVNYHRVDLHTVKYRKIGGGR